MSRVSSFAACALLVCASSPALAADALVVGSGTSGVSGPPLYRSSATTTSDVSAYQILFTAADLSGMAANSIITGIEFYKNSASVTTGEQADLEIWLRNVSDTSYAGTTTVADAKLNGTRVYSSTAQPIPAQMGFVALGNLDAFSPFTYTGGSLEMLVIWDCTQVPDDPTTGSIPWRSTAATNMVRGYVGTSAVNGTTVLDPTVPAAYRPNVRLSYRSSGFGSVTVRAGDGQRITDGATYGVDSLAAGVTVPVTYTVRNDGTAGVTLTTPVIQGATNCSATVTGPATTSLLPGASTTFTVNQTGAGAGSTAQYSVSIGSSNDPLSPTEWTVQGMVRAAAAPEIDVKRVFSSSLVSDLPTTIELGNALPAGQARPVTLRLANVGSGTLTFGSTPIAVTASSNATVAVVMQPPASLASQGDTTVVVNVTPTAAGPVTASLTINSDDADEGTKTVALAGLAIGGADMGAAPGDMAGPAPGDMAGPADMGVSAPPDMTAGDMAAPRAPEIEVAIQDRTLFRYRSSKEEAVAGMTFTSMVPAVVDVTKNRSTLLPFVITNRGTATLGIGRPTFVVRKAAMLATCDVEMTQSPEGTLDPGGSAPMVFKVNQNEPGCTLEISIPNSDPDENPFVVTANLTVENLPGGCALGDHDTAPPRLLLGLALAVGALLLRRRLRPR